MLLALLAVLLYAAPISAEKAGTDSVNTSTIPVFGYKIINTYPHDPSAFTQGLVYDDGVSL